ncbi:hypothetical protein TI39_contig301g00033 [Zymoseptoria brevis]|uniref:Uncharacterized protein n=1 Tax=Zymoseptoria brevis TaxID=1047168 RepID=A0A0F4GVU9_9PEZI|nr:hypothetical protein TI39_contig301g00033 [Zymoseptoria brevis]
MTNKMDQTTFLNELLTVKDRVNEMASTFGRSPRLQFSQTAPIDMFSNHLEDVKARLNSMQASLNLLSMGSSQRAFPLGVSPHWANRLNDFPSMPSAPSALPTGPLFWQLFNSVRADVRGLTDRVAGVEQDVSNLEDRLDDMRPNRFTPPESEYIPTSPLQHDYSVPYSRNEAHVDGHHHSTDYQGTPYLAKSYGVSSPSWVTPELSAQGTAECPAPEGVAFRDREIVALEDRVRELQDSLRYSEDLASQFRSERQSESNKVASLCQRLRDCTESNARYEVELDKSVTMVEGHDSAMQKLAQELTRKHELAMWEMSSRLHQKTQQFLAAQQQIHHLRSSMYDAQKKSQQEMDDMLAEKDGLLHKIREVAARNSAVVSQQQEIISRGAAIMEEKDDEIDRLIQKLDKSQAADRNEQQERDSCAKMLIERLTRELSKTQENHRNEQQELAEKSEEVVELRKALTKALTPNLPRGGQPQPRARPTVSPFATPLGRRASSMQWSPQALPQSSKLPHEVRRADIWNTASAGTRKNLKFGVPRQIKHVVDQNDHDSPGTLESVATADCEQRSTASALNHASPHRALHVDNFAKHHELLTRKSMSMADMRSRKGDGRETGSKQEFAPVTPRSSLQAYVEADEGSGGEQRGGAA